MTKIPTLPFPFDIPRNVESTRGRDDFEAALDPARPHLAEPKRGNVELPKYPGALA
jgi:hypothetical protein